MTALQNYSVEEASGLLGCSDEKTVEGIVSGDIPAVRFGRGWIIPASALAQRLHEKALEEAAKRRAQREAKGSAAKVIEKAGRREARKPPALPSLPKSLG